MYDCVVDTHVLGPADRAARNVRSRALLPHTNVQEIGAHILSFFTMAQCMDSACRSHLWNSSDSWNTYLPCRFEPANNRKRLGVILDDARAGWDLIGP